MTLLVWLFVLVRYRRDAELGWRRGWFLAGLEAKGWKVERIHHPLEGPTWMAYGE